MDSTTRHLVEFALGVDFGSLAADAVDHCRRRLVDTFAGAMGAFDDPLVVSMRELAAQYRGPAGATLWGTSLQSTPEMAAFANGTMLRVLDLNDTFLGREGGHPSDVVAGLVAAAEATGADGRSLVAATVVAYEIYCRFFELSDLGARGFDQPVAGVLATALGAGRLMGLDHERMGHAAALAVAPNLALRQTRHGELSSWKACAGANAARNGVFAATLAAHGVEGPADVFEGRQGLWSVISRFDWPSAEVLRTTRMITQTHLKSLPVCYHGQSAAQAAIALRAGLATADVADVHVETYRSAVAMIGGDPTRWAPRTRETADHSMPYIVATALAHGGVTVDSFDPARLCDPGVVALMAKIRVTEDPALTALWPQGAPARLTVRTTDGTVRRLEVRYPKGHVADPMDDAEIDAKFTAMAGARLGPEGCRSALDALWRIDQARDVGRQVIAPLSHR